MHTELHKQQNVDHTAVTGQLRGSRKGVDKTLTPSQWTTLMDWSMDHLFEPVHGPPPVDHLIFSNFHYPQWTTLFFPIFNFAFINLFLF